eukprot:3035698-Amphidinium_carterae.1
MQTQQSQPVTGSAEPETTCDGTVCFSLQRNRDAPHAMLLLGRMWLYKNVTRHHESALSVLA